MKLTLSELASNVNGKVIGDQKCIIKGVSEIQNGCSGTITFLSNPAYNKYLSDTKADAVFVDDASLLNGKNGIVVSNPQFAMAKTLELFFFQEKSEALIDSSAKIANSAIIGKNVSIGAGAVIGNNVKIGDHSEIGINTVIGNHTLLGTKCRLHSNISIYDKVVIGNNVIIHSGTSIGSDGYGYVTVNNMHKKIPQVGEVIIGDDVEIGSNCAIDRGTIGKTKIGDMTKIDNLVHIAHNVKIGKGCLLTAGFAIAGSSEVGDFCTFAGQVGIAPHLKIGNNSVVASKSGITKSLEGGKVYAGFPAREIKVYNRRQALVNKIEKIRKDLDHLIKSKTGK